MIFINGEGWRIKIVSPSHPALLTPEGTIALGCCDDNVKTIFINGHQTASRIKRTLSHEIVHALMYSYNIDIDDYTEEILAEIFSIYGEELIFLTHKAYNKFGFI